MLKSGRISVPVNKYKPPKPAIKLKPKTKPKKVIKPSKPKENETDKIIDPKEYKNKDDPNNLYWTEHFYIPNDAINQEYERLKISYKDEFLRLPLIFSNGVAQYDEKPETKLPIKQIVSFQKLKEGFYQIASSKSDIKNISSNISFFKKNLPSFKKYENTDDLSWVYNENRKLLLELLEYSFLRTSAIATIKQKINAMCRIIRLSLKTKNSYTYSKYSLLVSRIGLSQDDIDDSNLLTDLEMSKFVPFDFIMLKQIQLEQQFKNLTEDEKLTQKGYNLNQDLLLLSLYTLIPPLRDEIKTLEFTFQKETKGDFIRFFDNGDVYLVLNEIKKRHDPIELNLTLISPQLAEILKESYILYPRKPLFASIKSNEYIKKQVKTLSTNLIKIFSADYPDKNVGVNAIRSSYYSYQNKLSVQSGFPLQYAVKKQIAIQMRTSPKLLDSNYLKVYNYQNSLFHPTYPNQPPEEQLRMPEPRIIQPTDKTNIYHKKLEKNKEYIRENKEHIYKQQKEYRSKIPKEEQSRMRILRMLNNDSNYRDHIKASTIEKYKLKLDGNNKYY